MNAGNGWIRVGSLADVPPGESRAVKISEGRSVALFNVDGRIHATDNQCPHMGFPLTRGVVKDGVLTCDWHGRSFDLEGGGCFNYECDDLETFPVDIRGDELWVQAGDATYRRRDQHLQLLWEGLLSGDSWTISKATALLLSTEAFRNTTSCSWSCVTWAVTWRRSRTRAGAATSFPCWSPASKSAEGTTGRTA